MLNSEQFIDDFVKELSLQTFDGDDVYNEYAPNNPNNAIRRDNLRHYLGAMQLRKPDTMLVMEAPGYRGCRLTGVPVTSRKILLDSVPSLGMFGKDTFQNTDDEGFENIYGEQSATIVWNTLADLKVVPLIWNTFPFHPRKGNNPRSNRRPRKGETRIGLIFLRHLLAYFKPRIIVAAGNVAHETMTGAGIDCVKVRHPAQGGKHDFVAGLRALWN